MRWPWHRGALSGLVTLLLPLVWVVETGSCGEAPGARDLTGLEIAGRLSGDWWVLVPAVLLMVLTPWGAARLRGGARLAAHLVGLAATGLVAYGVYVALLFAIFSERALKGAGYLVAGCTVAAVGDALGRAVAGTREWWVDFRAR